MEANGKPVIKYDEDGNSIETPNGKIMSKVFEEAAQPDPDKVIFVDARTPEVEGAPASPPMEMENKAMAPAA